jgi:hypothetical protein
MAKMIVEHSVEDLSKCKSVFDLVDSLHKQFGIAGNKVYQNNSKTNDVVVISERGNHEYEKKWNQAAELKQAMI